MVSGTNTPSFYVPPICSPVPDGRRMPCRNTELFCRPTLHGRLDGFHQLPLGSTKRWFFPRQNLWKQTHHPVGNENQPCQFGWRFFFTSTTGVWQLQLKASPLKWVRLRPLPGCASIAGQHRGPACSQGQCHPRVHPSPAPLAAGRNLLAAAVSEGDNRSCSTRQSLTTAKLRTDVRKETVSCCSGSKSPLQLLKPDGN